MLLMPGSPERLAKVEQVKEKLLESTITGKQYAGRLQAGTPAKTWDEAFALLDELAQT